MSLNKLIIKRNLKKFNIANYVIQAVVDLFYQQLEDYVNRGIKEFKSIELIMIPACYYGSMATHSGVHFVFRYRDEENKMIMTDDFPIYSSEIMFTANINVKIAKLRKKYGY